MPTVKELINEPYSDWEYGFSAAGATGKVEEIAEVFFSDVSHGDYAETTVHGAFKMKSGKFGALYAGCDTTGWDCQCDGEWKEFDTEEEARAFAREGR